MSLKKTVNVLIVEDDILVMEMLHAVLHEIGYTVVGKAMDGGKAVEKTQSLQPDVILMDIEMPDVNGFEAMRTISACCPTPVVVVTAHETPELVAKASAAGAGAYLIKPPTAHEVERAIIIAMARFEDMVALRQVNKELTKRNEELDAFAHTVAYDLHSPLSLIIDHAETLTKDYSTLSMVEWQTILHVIVRSGRKMSNIIDALLLLAGVRNTKVELEPLDMASIVAEAQNRLTHLIKGYEPELILPAAWPLAVGYGPWIEEVWTNYLSNAIRHGGEPPQVKVGTELQPDGFVRFWVRDNGPGLTHQEQINLFTPFTRLDQVRTKGYGLGLSIVRRIVEKLGGQVGVESQGKVGQGSTFYFTLPSIETWESSLIVE